MEQYNQLFCGFIQGAIRVLLIYPFDAAKIQIQQQRYLSYNSWYKCTKRKWIYSGVQLPLVISSIEKAFTMTLYEDLNKIYGSYLLSAFIVSFISCIINVPIQVITNNYILDGTGALRKNIIPIINKGSIYRGYCIEAPRFFLSYTIYMGMYGNIRSYYEPNLLYTALNGYVCNLTISYMFYAFDIIKNTQQTGNMSVSQIIKKTSMTGISGFFLGSKLIFIRSFFAGSVTMMTYELLRQQLGIIKN
jgi:hypothetical protein